MLLKLLREKKPDHIAVVFDTKEPTFRDEMYKEYKSNRPPPPDDLIEQFPYFKKLLEALNIPSIELAGFEADDIIGTLAKKLASDELDVVIVSGDKDLMQLVGGGVSMYDSMKDKQIGEKEVIEFFGVEPAKVTDVLGLAGDPSDNIPGISGIGIATASKLIRQFESLENVLDNIDKLQGTLAYKIKNGAENARLSKKLVTIKTDVPLKYSLDDFAVLPPDHEKLHDLFQTLEFSKLISELSPRQAISREGYHLIQTEEDLERLIDEIKDKGRFSFDVETTSLNVMDAEIVGISTATEPGRAYYIPIGHYKFKTGLFSSCKESAVEKLTLKNEKNINLKYPESYEQLPHAMVLERFKPLLENEDIEKIGQNLKYDMAVLRRYGIFVKGLFCDTMIASYLLNPGTSHSLDILAQTYLDHRTIRYEEVVGKGKKQISFAEVPLETACNYSCEDADVAMRLSDILLVKLKEQKLEKLFFELEMPLIDVLLDMEQTGMKVDVEKLANYSHEFEMKLKELEEKIYAEAKERFNINSPRQLGIVLFEKLKLGAPKRTKFGYATDVGILEELALKHNLPALVLEYRSLSKLKSGYVDALPSLVNNKTGRIHTSFNQTVAATGRLSSSEPNLQNIPARTKEGIKIREAFIADKGNALISADYSQIELRVLAHLSQDNALIEAFKKGEDIHRITAAQIFGIKETDVTEEQRAVGKTVNFATIYGQGAFGLSKQLKIEVDVADKYINSFFKKYPSVEEYKKEAGVFP